MGVEQEGDEKTNQRIIPQTLTLVSHQQEALRKASMRWS